MTADALDGILDEATKDLRTLCTEGGTDSLRQTDKKCKRCRQPVEKLGYPYINAVGEPAWKDETYEAERILPEGCSYARPVQKTDIGAQDRFREKRDSVTGRKGKTPYYVIVLEYYCPTCEACLPEHMVTGGRRNG